MALSRKQIAEIKTYDPSELTSVGWKITLYADGHLSAQRRNRWADSRDMDRYVTDPDYIDTFYINENDPEEIQKRLEQEFSDEQLVFFEDMLDQSAHWRCTDQGILVR